MTNKSYFITILLPILACLTACQSPAPSQPESSYIPDIPTLDTQITTPTPITSPPIADSDVDGVADDKDACPHTPRNHLVSARGCSRPEPLEGQLKLELRIFFHSQSLTLRSSDSIYNEMNKVVRHVAEYPKSTIVVLGHSSKVETEKSPQNRLAHDRAQLVKEMLVAKGIASERIANFDCDDNQQIAHNESEEGAAMNQRVYLRIYRNDGSEDSGQKDIYGCQPL